MTTTQLAVTAFESSSVGFCTWLSLHTSRCGIATRILFVGESNDRVVTAATLYRLIDGNTVVEKVDSSAASESDYYYHLVYDFDEDKIKLLRVTPLEIRLVASYDRPGSTKHARFVKSWRELKITCDSSDEWPPPLENLVDVVDRRVLANVVLKDIRRKIARRPLTVSVSSSREGSTVVTYRYEDDDDVELRLTLPIFLDASVVVSDDSGGNDGGIKLRLHVKSPCSQPDIVRYDDFRRYYVARRAIASPPPLDANQRDVVLSRFRWRCDGDGDLDPTLVPVVADNNNSFF